MSELKQRALQLELKKRYSEAAELWLSAGQLDKALFNFQRGGKIKRAIDLALEFKMPLKAAELYVKAEVYDKAAELYRRERDYAAAGRAFRSGGRLSDAASMFEVAEQWSEAARLYESVNDFMKAGQLYEKGGDLANSARVYELAIDSKAVDRLGGKKDMARVAEVLTRVKNFEKAAEIYVQSQEVSEAILMFVRMGEVEGASRLLANCQGDVGFDVLSRIDYADEKAVEFARMFYLARDFQKAGRVFESCRQYDRAAYLFEKCQDYHHAGEMYAMAGEQAKAAASFEKAGSFADAADLYLRAQDPARAAMCFEAALDYYQAGRLYFEVERYDKAIDLLQKVDQGSPRYLDATQLVAELLRRKGYLDMAIDRYRVAMSGLACDRTTIDHFYNLACILIEKRDFVEAERFLSEVVRVNFSHRDAAQRLEQVRHAKEQGVALSPGPASFPVAPASSGESALGSPPATAGAAAADVPTAEQPLPASEASPPATFMVGRMDGFEVFSKAKLFEELTLAEMKRFWEFCELRSLRDGDVVLRDDAPGSGLFIIREGAVDVVKGDEILVRLHAGEFFGEMSLVDPTARTSAGIRAAGDVELFSLERASFERLVQASDSTALKMYRVFVGTLCARLRKANEDLAGRREAAG